MSVEDFTLVFTENQLSLRCQKEKILSHFQLLEGISGTYAELDIPGLSLSCIVAAIDHAHGITIQTHDPPKLMDVLNLSHSVGSIKFFLYLLTTETISLQQSQPDSVTPESVQVMISLFWAQKIADRWANETQRDVINQKIVRTFKTLRSVSAFLDIRKSLGQEVSAAVANSSFVDCNKAMLALHQSAVLRLPPLKSPFCIA